MKRRRCDLFCSGVLQHLLLVVAVVAATLVPTAPAGAHAELRQSSPEAGETVGGAVHSIALQFFDLDVTATQQASIFDAAGDPLPHQLNQQDQRLVLALIDPITTAGEYRVEYTVTGIDGDLSTESFSFRYEPGAPEPKGITVALDADTGFDWATFALLAVGAGLAAFLVHRFVHALREHRAVQRRAGAVHSEPPQHE